MRYITPYSQPYVSSFVGGLNPELLLKAGAEYQNRYDVTDAELAKLNALGTATPGVYRNDLAKELAKEYQGYTNAATQAMVSGNDDALRTAKQNMYKAYGMRGSSDWKSVEEDYKQTQALQGKIDANKGVPYAITAPGAYNYANKAYTQYGKGKDVPQGAYDIVTDNFIDQAMVLGEKVRAEVTNTVETEAVPLVDPNTNEPILDAATGQQKYTLGSFTGTKDDLSKQRFSDIYAENLKQMGPDLSRYSSFTSLGFRNSVPDPYYANLDVNANANNPYSLSDRQLRAHNDLMQATAGLMRINTTNKEQLKPLPATKIPAGTGLNNLFSILSGMTTPLEGAHEEDIIPEIAADPYDDNFTQADKAIKRLDTAPLPNLANRTSEQFVNTFLASESTSAMAESIVQKSASELSTYDLAYLQAAYKGSPQYMLNAFKEDMQFALDNRDMANMITTVVDESTESVKNDPKFAKNFNEEGKLINNITEEDVLDLQYKHANFPVKGSTIGMSKQEVVDKYGYNENDVKKDYQKLVEEKNPAFGIINKKLQTNLGRRQDYVKTSMVINDFIEVNGGSEVARNLTENLKKLQFSNGEGSFDLRSFTSGDRLQWQDDDHGFKLENGKDVYKSIDFDPLNVYIDGNDGEWKVFGMLYDNSDKNNKVAIGQYYGNLGNVAPKLITEDFKEPAKIYSKLYKLTVGTTKPLSISYGGLSYPVQRITDNDAVVWIGDQPIQAPMYDVAAWIYNDAQLLKSKQSGGTGMGKPVQVPQIQVREPK